MNDTQVMDEIRSYWNRKIVKSLIALTILGLIGVGLLYSVSNIRRDVARSADL